MNVSASIFRRLAPCVLWYVLASFASADHPGGGFGGVGAGAINTMSAATLARGQSAYALRMDYLDLRRLSDERLAAIGALGEHADSTDYTVGAFLTGAWGLTDELTLGVRIPYLYMNDIREPHDDLGMIEVENEGNSTGLGDIMALGQWRVLHWEREQVEAAIVGGLEMPSGLTSAVSREGEVFELEHQPGSGSWDPLVGLVVSKSWDRLSIHGNVLYQFATAGKQDTNLGDILNYNLAWAYRLDWFGDHYHVEQVPTEHAHDDHDHHDHDHGDHDHGDHDHGDHDHHAQYHGPTLDLVLEFNGVWSEKQEVAGVRDNNSGGNIIFVSPGARINFGGGHSLFASTQFPMSQDMNGFEHEVDFRLIVGASLVH